MPGHIRPRWRVVVAIVHRFLHAKTGGVQLCPSIADNVLRAWEADRFTMSFPSPCALAGDDGGSDEGDDLEERERG
jgi:hypothetical protein